jgi:signal transduction histidine kinase
MATLQLTDSFGSSRLMRVQDEECRRIARELHDDLGQELSAIKMMLEVAGSLKKAQLRPRTTSP